jgi:RNA polymerase sigma-70 factor (ECF subfamily)
VRIVAARIAGELASYAGRTELLDDSPAALADMLASGNPELELVRKDARALLQETLKKVLDTIPERERALLRLHHLHGLTMDKLAAMYGESRSGVARRVAAARERLLKLTRTELRVRLNLDPTDVESLLGLVQSRLDLSLRRMME